MADSAVPTVERIKDLVEIERSVLDDIIAKSMDVKGLSQFALVPKTFEEAQKYADYISKSQFCPKGFTSQDVFIAVQMGMELGIKPMAAIQGIAVINGRSRPRRGPGFRPARGVQRVRPAQGGRHEGRILHCAPQGRHGGPHRHVH